jgi:hypothetical protein
MTGDHPTDWPIRHVKAQALREAADDLAENGHEAIRWWLYDRADDLEQP